MSKTEADRMIVMLYRSENAHSAIGYIRPADWLDQLTDDGLEELENDLASQREDVLTEIQRRKPDEKINRAWYNIR